MALSKICASTSEWWCPQVDYAGCKIVTVHILPKCLKVIGYFCTAQYEQAAYCTINELMSSRSQAFFLSGTYLFMKFGTWCLLIGLQVHAERDSRNVHVAQHFYQFSSNLGCRTRQSKNYRNGCYFTVIRHFLKQQLTWLQYLWKQRVKVYIFTQKIYLICERDIFQLYITSLRELREKCYKEIIHLKF